MACLLYSLDGALGVRVHGGRVRDGEGDRSALVGKKLTERPFGKLSGAVSLIAACCAVELELHSPDVVEEGGISGGFGRGGQNDKEIGALVYEER